MVISKPCWAALFAVLLLSVPAAASARRSSLRRHRGVEHTFAFIGVEGLAAGEDPDDSDVELLLLGGGIRGSLMYLFDTHPEVYQRTGLGVFTSAQWLGRSPRLVAGGTLQLGGRFVLDVGGAWVVGLDGQSFETHVSGGVSMHGLGLGAFVTYPVAETGSPRPLVPRGGVYARFDWALPLGR